MWKITLLIFFVMLLPVWGGTSSEKAVDRQFQQNLSEMLRRTESSIKVLREQITQNQSAPFLADLYLQLGELLIQKANVLYYIQMERDQVSDTRITTAETKKFSPVTEALEEALSVFRSILSDFKSFQKRPKIYYLLAVALKSLDENKAFIETVKQLTKEFPLTEQDIRARVLLGQYYYEKQEYRSAEESFAPLVQVSYPYERNISRYYLGLIHQIKERFPLALKYFAEVAMDPEFFEEDNESQVLLKTKKVHSNLKREALMDSIKAFTGTFKPADAKPVEYYSQIAPTEGIFQEVIEKLALRYVSIKQYRLAVSLLRALSERVSDPEKVINIYQEALLLIPLEERLLLPMEEMRFVLEKYSAWLSYYQVSDPQRKASFEFFEKQIRDLGTRSHEVAKGMRTSDEKKLYWHRARDYYELYLGYFKKTASSAKMAVNLADVYFALGDYPQSGEYYLRVYLAEYGVPGNQQEVLLKNAILCAEKKTSDSFYDQVRSRGLLIKSLRSYIAISKEKARDPKFHFALAKAEYEQGLFEEALESLQTVVKKYPSSLYATDAGNLIIDYYNLRNDYEGLVVATDHLLSVPRLPPTFITKLKGIRAKADAKRLADIVKAGGEYDAFEEAKSYLKIAESVDDRSLASLALKTALVKSKKENDIQVYFQTAIALADKESQLAEKGKILQSIVSEAIRLTRFHFAREMLDSTGPVSRQVFEQRLELALVLRDWKTLGILLQDPMSKGVPSEITKATNLKLALLFQSQLEVPDEIYEALRSRTLSPEILKGAYLNGDKLPKNFLEKVEASISEQCQKRSSASVCYWKRLQTLETNHNRFLERLNEAPTQITKIEAQAREFQSLVADYEELSIGRDPHLDLVRTIRQSDLYVGFSRYLERTADANPQLRSVLEQKARESMKSAKDYRSRCAAIVTATGLVSPANRGCHTLEREKLKDLTQWSDTTSFKKSASDPSDEEIHRLQRRIFSNEKDGKTYVELVERYYQRGEIGHAVAAAEYGSLRFKDQRDDLKTLLGCSLVPLGQLTEARIQLKTGNTYGGLREKCLKEIKAIEVRS